MPQIPIKVMQNVVSLEELCEIVAKLQKQVKYWQNKNVDSENVFEVGGWRVDENQMTSADGDVGMSTLDTGGDDIRFFAGPSGGTYLFFVTKSGYAELQDANIRGTIEALAGHIGGFTIEADRLSSDSGEGIIEGGQVIGAIVTGGTVRTGASGARVEMSNNSLKTYNSDDELQGFAWGTDTGSATFGDAYFYSAGVKIAEFFNTITDGLSIYPSSGFSFRLGISGRTTTARGTWDFGPATVSGISQSAITNLTSDLSAIMTRLTYLENNAFVRATRSGNFVDFDSKNINDVDSVDVSG